MGLSKKISSRSLFDIDSVPPVRDRHTILEALTEMMLQAGDKYVLFILIIMKREGNRYLNHAPSLLFTLIINQGR